MIDRVAFYVLTLFSLFAAVMTLSGGNIPLSMLAAFVGGLLAKRLMRRLGEGLRGRSKRLRLDYARWLLDRWLLLDEAAQEEKIGELLLKHGVEAGELEVLAVPAGAKILDAERVLDVWRRHRGEDSVVFAAFCPASGSAASWAQKLKDPSIKLIDGNRLADFIAQDCPSVPEDWLKNEKRRISLKACGARIMSRVRPVKCGFYALAMLGLYLLRGHSSDLLLFALLAFMTAAAFRRKQTAV